MGDYIITSSFKVGDRVECRSDNTEWGRPPWYPATVSELNNSEHPNEIRISWIDRREGNACSKCKGEAFRDIKKCSSCKGTGKEEVKAWWRLEDVRQCPKCGGTSRLGEVVKRACDRCARKGPRRVKRRLLA